MTYTIVGTYRRTEYTLVWKDGKLRGTAFIKDLVEMYAAAYEGFDVGPVGQYTTTAHIKDPLSAIFIMRDVFDEIVSIEGDVPTAETIPEGRIG